MTLNADHYSYRTHWSIEDEAYVGTVTEFPSLSWADADLTAAFHGIRSLVAEVVAAMRASGERLPAAEPLDAPAALALTTQMEA